MSAKDKPSRLQVVKKYLDYQPTISQAKFAPMPRIYLELIECKKKVRPELRNKEYVPKEGTPLPPLTDAEVKAPISENFRLDDPDQLNNTRTTVAKKQKTARIIDLSKMDAQEISQMAEAKGESAEPSTTTLSSAEKKKILSAGFPKAGPALDERYRKNRESAAKEPISSILQSTSSSSTANRVEYFQNEPSPTGQSRVHESNSSDNYEHEIEQPKVSARKPREEGQRKNGLSSLMAPNNSSVSLEDVLSGQVLSQPVYSRPQETVSSISSSASGSKAVDHGIPQSSYTAPSLEQINSGKAVTDAKGMRDVSIASAVTPEEVSAETKKRDLFFKFKILRRLYKEAQIPDFPDTTPVATLQKEYDIILRQVSLDATVENYRRYLQIGFVALEFLLLNFAHFQEISGFAQQQIIGINQYDKVLYLLGEQNLMSGRKPWPPIVQLVGLIIFNAFIFVGSKMLFKSVGPTIANLFSQPAQNPSEPVYGTRARPAPQSASTSSSGRTRMRGPDISIEDLTGKKTR